MILPRVTRGVVERELLSGVDIPDRHQRKSGGPAGVRVAVVVVEHGAVLQDVRFCGRSEVLVVADLHH